MTIVEITGGMLRAARSLTDLSQQEVAERASISRPCLTAWEGSSGNVPNAKARALHRVVSALSAAMLLGGVAAAWPLTARAQQAGKLYRPSVFLGVGVPSDWSNLDGWLSCSGCANERFAEIAAEFVRLKTDIIVIPTAIRLFPSRTVTNSAGFLVFHLIVRHTLATQVYQR